VIGDQWVFMNGDCTGGACYDRLSRGMWEGLEAVELARGRPLKVGLHLDIAEYPEDYAFGHAERARPPDRWAELLELAQAAERAGFDSVWVPDHLLMRIEPGKPEGSWDCLTILAALAAVTTRLELATAVLCMPFRNPALLAKMAATIDEISGGRFILGIGAGWHEPEFRAFGVPFDHRASRFEEALAIVHGLLTTGRVDFEGVYYSARECELRPRGPRPSGPPIMIGTTGPRMLALTARYAGLWNHLFDAQTGDRYENYARVRATVDAACLANGRDPATLGRTLYDAVNVFNRPGYAMTKSGPPLAGTPEQIANGLRRYADAGVSHVYLGVFPFSVAGIEGMAPVLEALDCGG